MSFLLKAAAGARRRVSMVGASDDGASSPSSPNLGASVTESVASKAGPSPRSNAAEEQTTRVSCVLTWASARLGITKELAEVVVRSDGLFLIDKTKLLVRHVALPAIAGVVWLAPNNHSFGSPRLVISVRGEHDILLSCPPEAAAQPRSALRGKERQTDRLTMAETILRKPVHLSAQGAIILPTTSGSDGPVVPEDQRRSAIALFTVATALRFYSRAIGDFCPFLEVEGDLQEDPEASIERLASLRPAADYRGVAKRVQLRRRGSDKYVPPDDQLSLAVWDSVQSPLPPPLPIRSVVAWARWAVPSEAHLVMTGEVLLLNPVAYFDEENRPVIVERAARLRGSALAAASQAVASRMIMKRAAKQMTAGAGAGGGPGDGGGDDDETVPAVAVFTANMLLLIYDPLRTVRLHLALLQAAVVHRTPGAVAPRRLELMFATAEASCTVDMALGTAPYAEHRADMSAGPQNTSGDASGATHNSSVVADVAVSLCNRLGVDVKVTGRNVGATTSSSAAAGAGTSPGAGGIGSDRASIGSMSSPRGGPQLQLGTRAASTVTDFTRVGSATGGGLRFGPEDDADDTDGTSDPGSSSGDDDADNAGGGARDGGENFDRRLADTMRSGGAAPSLFRRVVPTHGADDDGGAADPNDAMAGGTSRYLAVDMVGDDVWGAVTFRGRKAAAAIAAAAAAGDKMTAAATGKPYRPLRLVPDRKSLPEPYQKMFGAPGTILVRWVLRETSKPGTHVGRFAVLISRNAHEAFSADVSDDENDNGNDASLEGNRSRFFAPLSDDEDEVEEDDLDDAYDVARSPDGSLVASPSMANSGGMFPSAGSAGSFDGGSQRRRGRSRGAFIRRRDAAHLLLCDKRGKVHRDVDLARVCRVNCVSSEDRVELYICGERPLLLRPDGERTRAPGGSFRDCRVGDLATVMAYNKRRAPPFIVSAPNQVADPSTETTAAQAAAWTKEANEAIAQADAEIRESRLTALRVAAKAAGTGAVRKDAHAKAMRHAQNQQQQRDAFDAADAALRAREGSIGGSQAQHAPQLPNGSSPPGQKRRPMFTTAGGASSLLTALHNDERVRRHAVEDTEQGVLRVLWMRQAVEIRKTVELEVKTSAKATWALERRVRAEILVTREEAMKRIKIGATMRRTLAPVRFAGRMLHLVAHEDTRRRFLNQDASVGLFRLHRDALTTFAGQRHHEDDGELQRREAQRRRGIATTEELTFQDLSSECDHGVAALRLLRQHAAAGNRLSVLTARSAAFLESHRAQLAFDVAVAGLFAEAVDDRVGFVQEWRESVDAERRRLQRAAVVEQHRIEAELTVVQQERHARSRILFEGLWSEDAAETAEAQHAARSRLLALHQLQVLESTARHNLSRRFMQRHVDEAVWYASTAMVLSERQARRVLEVSARVEVHITGAECAGRAALYVAESRAFYAFKAAFVAALPRPSRFVHLRPGESAISARAMAAAERLHAEADLARRLESQYAVASPITLGQRQPHSTEADNGSFDVEFVPTAEESERDLTLAVSQLDHHEEGARSAIVADEIRARSFLDCNCLTDVAAAVDRNVSFFGGGGGGAAEGTSPQQGPSAFGNMYASFTAGSPPLQRRQSSAPMMAQSSSSPRAMASSVARQRSRAGTSQGFGVGAGAAAAGGGGAGPLSISPAARTERPGWMPNALTPLGDCATPPDAAQHRGMINSVAHIGPPVRGSYEQLGMYRLRCKTPISAFVIFVNQGFSRRLEAAGGSSEQWGQLDPINRVVCIGDALSGPAAVTIETMQRLLLNASCVSTGSRAGGAAGMPPAAASTKEAAISALDLAGFDPVVSQHVSIKLPPPNYATVDIRDFLRRWVHRGQDPFDMVMGE